MQNSELKKKSEVLRNCPFCGGEAEIRKKYIKYDGVVKMEFGIRCERCFARTMSFFEEKEAIKAWNNRKPITDIVERLESEKFDIEDCRYDVDLNTTMDMAIEIVKEVGGLNV